MLYSPVINPEQGLTTYGTRLVTHKRRNENVTPIRHRIIMHLRRHSCETQSSDHAVDLVTDAFQELAILQDVDDGLKDGRRLYHGNWSNTRLAQAAALRYPVGAGQQDMEQSVDEITIRVNRPLLITKILAVDLNRVNELTTSMPTQSSTLTSSNLSSVFCAASMRINRSETSADAVGRLLASLISAEKTSCSTTSAWAARRAPSNDPSSESERRL